MKEIKITECKMDDALLQIDAISALNPKESSCLRLLTEEMFSMCMELLKVNLFEFKIDHQGNKYVLCISTKTQIDESVRTQLLSVSSSGKNTANKGIKGMLGAILEVFAIEGDPATYRAEWTYGMITGNHSHASMWSLSQYMDTAPKEKIRKEWDGIEKSIIASFADDVSIAVRSGMLEMAVTKQF